MEDGGDHDRRRSRSVSPFVKQQRSRCVVIRGSPGGGGGGGEDSSFRVIPLQPPSKGEVVQLCPVSPSRVLGVSDEGRVWGNGAIH